MHPPEKETKKESGSTHTKVFTASALLKALAILADIADIVSVLLNH